MTDRPTVRRDEKDHIIDEMVTLMTSGRWIRGRTVKELAQKHALNINTARNYSAIASKIAWSGSDEDVAEMRATSVGRLQVISLKAEADKEYHAATGAIKTAAEIAGVLRPGGDVNVLIAPDGTIKNEQLRSAMANLIARVTEAIDAAELTAEQRARFEEAMGVVNVLPPSVGEETP